MTRKKDTGQAVFYDESRQKLRRFNLTYRLVMESKHVDEVVEHMLKMGFAADSANDPATSTEKGHLWEVSYCVPCDDPNFYIFIHNLIRNETIVKYEVC